MFASLKRAFSPLDTSEVDAAIAQASAAHLRTRACARALRMDVSCGDATQAIQRVAARLGTGISRQLHDLYPPVRDIDPDMGALLDKI